MSGPERKALARFRQENRGFAGKGGLSVALVVTRHAVERGLPLDPDRLLTGQGGQVLGLGFAAVQAILAEHGETRVLAREAGRTSRGSIAKMRGYVACLNALAAAGPVDLGAAEAFWVEAVRGFLAGKPFRLRLDPALGLRAPFADLLRQAEARQRENPGMQYAGAVLQHLIGAALDCDLEPGTAGAGSAGGAPGAAGAIGAVDTAEAAGRPGTVGAGGAVDTAGGLAASGSASGAAGWGRVAHHGFAAADAAGARAGDFLVGDVAIHVTTAPGEAVLRRCRANVEAGLRAVLVTVDRNLRLGEGLAENAGLSERIDVLSAEQFLAAGLHRRGGFTAAGRRAAAAAFVARYNAIVAACETDPSLGIDFET